jgi:glucose/arabinose dehydrogenase
MRGKLAACLLMILLCSGAVLAETGTSDREVLKGPEAFGDWQKDKPGVRRLLKPADQAPVGQSTSNPVQIVKRSKHAKPIAPKGFSVDLIASGFAEPRVIRVAPNGDLFVADSEANTIRVFRVPTGRTRPVKSHIYASGLNKPFGIAFYPLQLADALLRIREADSLSARFRTTSVRKCSRTIQADRGLRCLRVA